MSSRTPEEAHAHVRGRASSRRGYAWEKLVSYAADARGTAPAETRPWRAPYFPRVTS